MFIKQVGCDCPCGPDPCTPATAPDPTLKCDSISATKTKCGFPEWSGYESNPPKIYLTCTLSGSVTFETNSASDCSGSCESKIVHTWSGSCAYSRSDCSFSSSSSYTVDTFDPCDNLQSSVTTDPCPDLDDSLSSGVTNSYNSTVHTLTGDGCYAANFNASGSATATLSDEYTTTALISDVEAALPAYPGTWAGTCGAYRDLSSDEMTYTIRRFKYKFQLPDLTGYNCYRITWNEGSTPMSYQWDGVATETPEYGPINEPASNGTIDITNIVATCTC
jgi:hypothetical protein